MIILPGQEKPLMWYIQRKNNLSGMNMSELLEMRYHLVNEKNKGNSQHRLLLAQVQYEILKKRGQLL